MNQMTRLSLVDRADGDLSIVAQCRLLKVARSSLYWRPAAVSEDDLRLMEGIASVVIQTTLRVNRPRTPVTRPSCPAPG